MEIDSSGIGIKKERVPDNVHTVFNFALPFVIPIPDGLYELSLGGKKADLVIKRIQKKDMQGGFSSSGYVQIRFDKYGATSFSSISMTFRYKMNLEENGRTPLLFGNIPPRNKAKETVVRFLNRFIEVVKFETGEFWVPRVRYQDLMSYQVAFWDGRTLHPAKFSILDSGVGGIMMSNKFPFQVEKQTLDSINNLLGNESQLDSSFMLFLNSKDACLQEDFRLAIVEAVAGLEVVLYNFIRVQGRKIGLPDEDLEDFIVRVGLTGNVTTVLRMLTQELEQINDSILRECKGAIKIRNKILHEGLQDVASTDTEKRVIAIGQMIDYLKRITPH